MNFWNHLFYFNSNDPTLCYTLQRTTISANSLQYPFQFHSMPLAIYKSTWRILGSSSERHLRLLKSPEDYFGVGSQNLVRVQSLAQNLPVDRIFVTTNHLNFNAERKFRGGLNIKFMSREM